MLQQVPFYFQQASPRAADRRGNTSPHYAIILQMEKLEAVFCIPSGGALDAVDVDTVTKLLVDLR